MQLWHPSLLPELPSHLLTALHRDVCRIRSSVWRSPTNTRTWFYSLPWGALIWYHNKILREMQTRGWKPSAVWFDPLYRGRNLPLVSTLTDVDIPRKKWESIFNNTCPIPQDKFERMLQKWKSARNKR